MVSGEAVHILIKIEYDGNTDDKQDGVEVGPQELAYQVSVYSFKKWDFHKWNYNLLVTFLIMPLFQLE
jgi:hypothetical protein